LQLIELSKTSPVFTTCPNYIVLKGAGNKYLMPATDSAISAIL